MYGGKEVKEDTQKDLVKDYLIDVVSGTESRTKRPLCYYEKIVYNSKPLKNSIFKQKR